MLGAILDAGKCTMPNEWLDYTLEGEEVCGVQWHPLAPDFVAYPQLM